MSAPRLLLLLSLTVCALAFGADTEVNPVRSQPPEVAEAGVQKLIVKFREPSQDAQLQPWPYGAGDRATNGGRWTSRNCSTTPGSLKLDEFNEQVAGMHAMQVRAPDTGESLATTLARLQLTRRSATPIPDYRRHILATPNDPLFQGLHQWHLEERCQHPERHRRARRLGYDARRGRHRHRRGRYRCLLRASGSRARGSRLGGCSTATISLRTLRPRTTATGPMRTRPTPATGASLPAVPGTARWCPESLVRRPTTRSGSRVSPGAVESCPLCAALAMRGRRLRPHRGRAVGCGHSGHRRARQHRTREDHQPESGQHRGCPESLAGRDFPGRCARRSCRCRCGQRERTGQFARELPRCGRGRRVAARRPPRSDSAVSAVRLRLSARQAAIAST